MTTKMCLKCGNVKPLTEFSPCGKKKSGDIAYQPYCKACRRQHRAKRYHAERSKELQWRASYRKENQGKIKEYRSVLMEELSESYIIPQIKQSQRRYGLSDQPITQEMIEAKRADIIAYRRDGVKCRRRAQGRLNQDSVIKTLIQSRCKSMGFLVGRSEIRPPAIHHYRQQLIAKRQQWADDKARD